MTNGHEGLRRLYGEYIKRLKIAEHPTAKETPNNIKRDIAYFEECLRAGIYFRGPAENPTAIPLTEEMREKLELMKTYEKKRLAEQQSPPRRPKRKSRISDILRGRRK